MQLGSTYLVRNHELTVGRYALLVATEQHEDALFRQLRSPAQNVRQLERVLREPAVGKFNEVTVLQDSNDAEIRRQVEDVLAVRTHEDFVMVYFSCHGVTDRFGRLHFVATNTRIDRLASTAISSAFVSDCLEHSRAGGRILVLDCCHSGAFARGFSQSAMTRPLEGEILANRGYVCITAGNAFEYSFEGYNITLEEPLGSVFTDTLIFGLETGLADTDHDGQVEAFELFQYVSARVRETAADQTPMYFAAGVQGELIVSYTRRWGTSPASQSHDVRADPTLGHVNSGTPEELIHWHAIEDSLDYRDYEDFLARWPSSHFAEQCLNAMRQLR